ncbi:hypothetical protein RHMOL_Rhmol08G0105100 [Rhododendron molle]|uniref:Uncharacterized protein n=1 Tax=Rhododendron molle TaxID=49168 RepID=A0ACC0MN03_RHOML|nr:hypothetical protein RHMOL_Rhmol08G0105100 [Rhododendron molle]
MTPVEFEIYRKQVQETGGFDVVLPPGVGDCGLIYPCPNFDRNPRVFEEVNRCASKAIDVYNKEYKTKYRFLRVIKLSSMSVSGYNHYITFEANANGAAPIHFQALVYAGIPKDRIEVISCRPKPNSPSWGTTKSPSQMKPLAPPYEQSMDYLLPYIEDLA